MKYNKKIIQEKSNKLFNNEYKIIGEYEGINKKCLTLHKVCGYQWLMNLNNHINKKRGCPKCAGNKKLTIDEVQEISDIVHNKEYKILDFKSTSKKSKILHYICGNILDVKISSHIYSKTGCSYCAGNKKLTIGEIKIDEEYELISTEYINNISDLNFRHKKCGNEFSCSLNNFKKSVYKCPFCFSFRKLSMYKIKELSNKLHNNEYEFLSNYVNSSTPILTKHKKCGYIWNMWILNHLRIDKLCGCPNCSISIGEKKIQSFFKLNGIEFEIQKEFENCKNIKKLPFDFYLHKYNLCIEYDGEQHFRPMPNFSLGLRNI